MFSISRNDDAPVSRADARPRGALVLATLGLWAGLALLAPPLASAQRAPCLPFCDPMNPDPTDCCPECVTGACQEYRECQLDNRTRMEECIDGSLDGTVQPGNCNFALNRSRFCAIASNVNCAASLQESLEIGCGDCRIGRGAGRRACNRCLPKDPPVCNDLLADGSGSKCQKQCIRRVPWIGECYRRCDQRCAKDRCATAICRRGCRNSICNQLVNKCLDGSDPQYLNCCLTNDCSADGVDTLSCQSTTSTTSSTTSSTSVQTTSTTTRTTSSTTSTVRATP
jgi:hypothetical protein